MTRHAPRILLVDDDDDWRVLMAEVLEENGFRVAQAENGRDALEQLRRAQPMTVITDLQMPVMDGSELLQLIHKGSPALPVIMLSASEVGARDIATAFRTVHKPTDPLTVVALAREAVALAGAKRSLRTKALSWHPRLLVGRYQRRTLRWAGGLGAAAAVAAIILVTSFRHVL